MTSPPSTIASQSQQFPQQRFHSGPIFADGAGRRKSGAFDRSQAYRRTFAHRQENHAANECRANGAVVLSG